MDTIAGVAAVPQPRLPAGAALDIKAELAEIELLPGFAPDEALRRAEAVAQALAADRSPTSRAIEELRMRTQLVQADARGRLGQSVASAREFRQVNRWAAENDCAYVLARSHRLLAMFFAGIGDDVAMLEHALLGVELLTDDVSVLVRGDHVCTLALAQGRNNAAEASRESFAAAETLINHAGHPLMLARSINNLAYVEHLAGAHERAVTEAERMKRTMTQHGLIMTAMHVDTVARAYLDAGRYADAERTLTDFLPDISHITTVEIFQADGAGELLCTLAEAQLCQGSLDAATLTLGTCLEVCESNGLDGITVRVHRQLSSVLEAQGRYAEALTELKLHLELAERLNSTAREVRARTLQTIYETEAARRSSQRFEDMAQCDPLTGLFNRRYVDTQFPNLAAQCAVDQQWLSVAFIDLDHFKRINDTLSHDTGDQVLRQISVMLQEVVQGLGFAARMGGEEFLLVLPGLDVTAGARVCKQLIDNLRAYDWTPITGTMPVRASVGLAAALGSDADQLSLLAEADRNVYAAKSGGRDRLVLS